MLKIYEKVSWMTLPLDKIIKLVNSYDIVMINRMYCTWIEAACINNLPELLVYILTNKIDTLDDANINSAIFYTCEHCSIDALKVFSKFGYNMNRSINYFYYLKTDIPNIEKIINENATSKGSKLLINECMYIFDTCKGQRLEMINYILSAGYDSNKKYTIKRVLYGVGKTGEYVTTPIHDAAYHLQFELLELLIINGGDVDSRGLNNNTLFEIISYRLDGFIKVYKSILGGSVINLDFKCCDMFINRSKDTWNTPLSEEQQLRVCFLVCKRILILISSHTKDDNNKVMASLLIEAIDVTFTVNT